MWTVWKCYNPLKKLQNIIYIDSQLGVKVKYPRLQIELAKFNRVGLLFLCLWWTASQVVLKKAK